MEDFLTFRKMITPVLIQVIFWVGVVVAILNGVRMIKINLIMGIVTLVVGPVLWRVWCELMIVMFKILETLTDMRDSASR